MAHDERIVLGIGSERSPCFESDGDVGERHAGLERELREEEVALSSSKQARLRRGGTGDFDGRR